MTWTLIAWWLFGSLCCLNLGILMWQTWAGWRFPLHRRRDMAPAAAAATVLKPLKGLDSETRHCLQSWMEQDFTGSLQFLFGVAVPDDPVCQLVRELQATHPGLDIQLVICPESFGPNAKVSTLIQLEGLAKHPVVVISDADVLVPPDCMRQLLAEFHDQQIGLVNCFYALANPATTALRWEAVAINADFWSQVLQNLTFAKMNYALGAVMAIPRDTLRDMGGFRAVVDYLADDYQLGNRIFKQGKKIVLSPVVVECWTPPQSWRQVWSHQLRWSRTIRFCHPVGYGLSVLSNATLWPLLWLAFCPGLLPAAALVASLSLRAASAAWLQFRLTRHWAHLPHAWLAPVKDLLAFALWLISWTGRDVIWRGQRFRIQHRGRLQREN